MAENPAKRGGPGVAVDVAAFKAAREVKGWSQKQLALETGCSPRTVERIEARGTALISNLHEIAEALGVEVAKLRPSPEPQASPFAKRLFQLPVPLVDFTGRAEQLAHIAARLRGNAGSVGLSSAFRGMGGVGKTTLAVEVAHEVKDHFPDAQLVVDLQGTADRPLSPVEVMARIIRDFHPEAAKLPETEAEMLPVYRSVLKDKRAIILLDNAKDEAQVKGLLTAAPPVAFVVTSRHALALECVESVRVDVLPPDEALTLLRHILPTKGTDDELRTVAELCGRLPLALRVAGDFLRLHDNWTLPGYTEALRDEATRLARLKGKTPDRDVEAVLALSARELIRENPERAERWQLLSVFPADFDVLAVCEVWNLKSGEGNAARPDFITTFDELTALLDRSLVQFTSDRYELHDLMRPIARAAFDYVEGHASQSVAGVTLRAAERRFVWYFAAILKVTNELYLSGHDGTLAALALFDQEARNIRHGQHWASLHRESDCFATEMCRDYALNGALTTTLRLSSAEKIAWMETALIACRVIGDRSNEMPALGNLGSAWHARGDVRKAIDFYEQALSIAREMGTREDEGSVLNNLGLVWADLGDARKAIDYYEQSLTITRESGDRRSEGLTLGNLGSAWGYLGEARKAIGFYGQALSIAREIGDRRNEGTTVGNLGIAWRHLGEAPTAQGCYEQQLVIARELGDRRVEAFALSNLGIVSASLGDIQRAVVFYEQALSITREVGDRRLEGAALGNLGLAWAKIGDTLKAIEFHEQALAIAREVGDRRSEGASLGNLGVALANLGEAHKAINYYEKQLVIVREIEDLRGEASANWNMAAALVALNRNAEALPFAEQAQRIYEAIESPQAEEVRQTLAEWRQSVN